MKNVDLSSTLDLSFSKPDGSGFGRLSVVGCTWNTAESRYQAARWAEVVDRWPDDEAGESIQYRESLRRR